MMVVCSWLELIWSELFWTSAAEPPEVFRLPYSKFYTELTAWSIRSTGSKRAHTHTHLNSEFLIGLQMATAGRC
jgi:hypothetical protein